MKNKLKILLLTIVLLILTICFNTEFSEHVVKYSVDTKIDTIGVYVFNMSSSTNFKDTFKIKDNFNFQFGEFGISWYNDQCTICPKKYTGTIVKIQYYRRYKIFNQVININ